MQDLIHAVSKHPDDFLGVGSDLGCIRNYQLRMPAPERHRISNADRTTFIIGELLDKSSGTMLGAVGNRPGGALSSFLPIKEYESIQDAFALGRPISYGADFVGVWDQQAQMLNRYINCDKLNDEIKREYPSVTLSWENQGILSVLWEKYITVDRTRVEVRPTRTMAGVVEGCFYEPTVLGDAAKPYSELMDAALVQHAIFDEKWNVIPPWNLAERLTPGDLLLVLVSLHCKDIDFGWADGFPEFYRSYEIRGHSAVVIRRNQNQTR